MLIDSAPDVVPHSHMFKALYGGSKPVNMKTIRVLMTNLRISLRMLGATVHTVHSAGYMLVLNQVTPEVTK